MKDGLTKHADGSKIWYLNDRIHREDGPAVEYSDGSKIWYIHGKRHRENGPSMEYADGTKYWYLNDREYSEEAYWNEVISLIVRRKTLTIPE